jgi:hypothetical protein
MYDVHAGMCAPRACITRCPAGYGTVRDINGTNRRRSRPNYVPLLKRARRDRSLAVAIDFPARRLRASWLQFGSIEIPIDYSISRSDVFEYSGEPRSRRLLRAKLARRERFDLLPLPRASSSLFFFLNRYLSLAVISISC